MLLAPDLDDNGIDDVILDIDGDGTNDFTFEIRCIEATGTAIAAPFGDLSDAADNLPVMQHVSIPPVGSGYSLKYFEVRRLRDHRDSIKWMLPGSAGCI